MDRLDEPLEIERIPREKEIRQKRNILLLFLVLMIVNGMLMASPKWDWIIDKMGGALVLATATVWCMIDARANGRVFNMGWYFGFVMLFPVFFPVYMFKEKGLKAGGLVIVKAAGLLLLALVLSVISNRVAIPFLG